jgi:hypothetical protein
MNYLLTIPTHTPGHDLTPRTIYAAALLAERFMNPDVAAYNRSYGGGRHRTIGYIVAPSTERREHFWYGVGRALSAAYGRRDVPTDYERAVRRSIDNARAAIAKAVKS